MFFQIVETGLERGFASVSWRWTRRWTPTMK